MAAGMRRCNVLSQVGRKLKMQDGQMVRQVRMVRAENIHHPFLDLIYGHDSLGEALKKTISIWLRWSSYAN